MMVSIIKLYDLLKARIGEREAEAFIEILEKKVDEKFDEKKNILATKEDLLNVREGLSAGISNVRSELLRTIYLTSLGQLIAIITSVVSIILVLKK
jgi:hypothetical protein